MRFLSLSLSLSLRRLFSIRLSNAYTQLLRFERSHAHDGPRTVAIVIALTAASFRCDKFPAFAFQKTRSSEICSDPIIRVKSFPCCVSHTFLLDLASLPFPNLLYSLRRSRIAQRSSRFSSSAATRHWLTFRAWEISNPWLSVATAPSGRYYATIIIITTWSFSRIFMDPHPSPAIS